jgi:hypothetical protein
MSNSDAILFSDLYYKNNKTGTEMCLSTFSYTVMVKLYSICNGILFMSVCVTKVLSNSAVWQNFTFYKLNYHKAALWTTYKGTKGAKELLLMKLRRMRWTGRVMGLGGRVRNAYEILVSKPEEMKPLGWL